VCHTFDAGRRIYTKRNNSFAIRKPHQGTLGSVILNGGPTMQARTAISVAFLLLSPSPSRATTIVAVSEAELTKMADAVVWATVMDSQSYMDAHNRIMTKVQMQVVKGLYGAKTKDMLTVEIPGGHLANGLTATVPGAPRLALGEMVFAFLRAHGKTHRSLGLSFGMLKVHKNALGTYSVSRSTDDLNLVSRQGKSVAAETVRIKDEPLNDLITRVQAHIEEAHGHGPQRGQP
jgi:hypothetical protein